MSCSLTITSFCPVRSQHPTLVSIWQHLHHHQLGDYRGSYLNIALHLLHNLYIAYMVKQAGQVSLQMETSKIIVIILGLQTKDDWHTKTDILKTYPQASWLKFLVWQGNFMSFKRCWKVFFRDLAAARFSLKGKVSITSISKSWLTTRDTLT